MDKFNCEMCMDLMPLVQDGVASEGSRNAVLQHLEECPDCKALYEGDIPAPSDTGVILDRILRKTQTFFVMVMMFGIFYALMLTEGSNLIQNVVILPGSGLFRNVIIMPVIGALSYYLFRRKAFVILPPMLLVAHFLINAFAPGEYHMSIADILLWAAIYYGLALVGYAIAALLHFALKKEDEEE